MSSLRILLLAAFPISIVWTFSWFGVFTFVNAYVARDLGRSNEAWTQLTLCFMGGVVFWQILVTEISARIGRRTTIMFAMGVTALLYVAVGFVTSQAALGALLAIAGIMPAVAVVVWLPMAAEAGGDRPGRALALSQVISHGLGALALVAGGYLLSIGGFRTMFLVVGAACLASMVAFYVITLPPRNHSPGHIVSLFSLTRSDVAGLARGMFPWVLLLGVCIEPFNFHTANQLFPNLARDIHGLSEQKISAVVGLMRLPGLLSLFLLAHWIDRLIPSACYGVGLISAGLALRFMGGAGAEHSLILGYGLFYLGHGMVWGSNTASVNACGRPHLRDSAFAIMSVSMVTCVFGVGLVHNRLLDRGYSLPAVFRTCGAIAAVGGVMLILRSLAGRRGTPTDGTQGSAVRDQG